MNETQARELVAQSGRMLLREGLTARTWGNISCRAGSEIAITPSGLGYENMTAEDVVMLEPETGEWRGSRKPSSEKAIHASAYAAFPEAGFVIHTHQTYASALGIAGYSSLNMTPAERQELGGLALAEYGLPGTKKLAGNVERAYRAGAHTVLMAHHGAVIAGRNREEAFARAKLLESICRRACRGQENAPDPDRELAGEIFAAVKLRYPHAGYSDAPEALKCAAKCGMLPAQLDDMAQMIGPVIPVSAPNRVSLLRAMEKTGVVLVPGAGAYFRSDTDGDLHALKLLAEKACVCWLHADALGTEAKLSLLDTLLMRTVYLKKYSKKAAG